MTAYVYPDSGGETFVNRTGPQTITGPKTFLAGSATSVPTVIRQAVGQTANMTEWQNSDGVVMVSVNQNGAVHQLQTNSYMGRFSNVMRGFDATYVPLTINAAASQTANIQEWQDVGGTVLSAIGNNGWQWWGHQNTFISAFNGRGQFTPREPGVVPLTATAAAGQTANIQEWKNSAGNVWTYITASGHLHLDRYSPGQTDAIIRARKSGNALEFGHGNQAGYGSVIGAENGSGMPAIVFLGEHGTTSNTYTSRGFAPIILRANASGALEFATISAGAANAAPVTHASLGSSGLNLINSLANNNGNNAATRSPSLYLEGRTWDSAAGNQAMGASLFVSQEESNTVTPSACLVIKLGRDGGLRDWGYIGNKGIYMYDVPAAPPHYGGGGGSLYVEGGALKWKGGAGTTTTIANA